MGKDDLLDDNLVYKVDDIEGVEIDVLCKSLKAIGDEYQRFTNNQKRLVVKEVRKGSGIFEFIELIIVPAFAAVEFSNTILQFAEYLATAKDVILKKKKKLPDNIPLTKTTVDNVNSILSPVINGNNNTVNIFVGAQSVMSVDQEEYREVKSQSKQALKELKAGGEYLLEDKTYNKVLFQWVQTRFDSSKVGNRGVIKQIQEKPVKVIFADDDSSSKAEMTTSTSGIDWQKVKYIVDVEAMADDNHIVAYKILKNYPDDSIVEDDTDPELF